MKRTQRREMT